jgi:hypothetical protein
MISHFKKGHLKSKGPSPDAVLGRMWLGISFKRQQNSETDD